MTPLLPAPPVVHVEPHRAEPGDAAITPKVTAGFHLGPVPPDPTALAQMAARQVLGKRFGLVRSCDELAHEPGMPRLQTWVARGPVQVPGWQMRSSPEGTGVSTAPEPARLAAISEVLERYASMAPADERLLMRANFRDLMPAAVQPGSFALPSKRQYRRLRQLDPLTEHKVVDWCWAFSLTRSHPVLVPAAFVYYACGGRPPNDFLPELCSSGLACHVSLTHATLAGLCEVLERDALTIAWQNRLLFTPLDPAGTVAGDLVEGALSGCGVEFSLYRIPTDSPFPVILALASSQECHPHAVVGAACRPDPVDGGVKALVEVSQMLRRLRGRPVKRPTRVREFDDHSDLYATPAGASLLRRHLKADGPPQLLARLAAPGDADPAAQLAGAVTQLADVGLEVLVVDLTTPDLAPTGYRVVRVMVPGTVDMSADARLPRLGAARLYDLPVRLGLREQPLAEEALNLAPGPLA